jgi:CRISPR-associated endonuclease Csn1
MADNEIPEGFIDRQLRETQYIAKAKEILLKYRNVTATIGSVTDKLREDWELVVEVMKELNWDKYHKLGLTKEKKAKRRTVI